MKIYSALQIGEYHTNHCEDYLFFGEMGSDKVVCTVMDGCTTAIDSYFVATLVGKLLCKIIREIAYQELYYVEIPVLLQSLYYSSYPSSVLFILDIIFPANLFGLNTFICSPKPRISLSSSKFQIT